MLILSKVVHFFFPLIAFLLLIWGVKRSSITYIISALWLSIISLIIHFQFSGSQILGTYFNYTNAALYSLNLVIVFVAIFCIIAHLDLPSKFYQLSTSFLKAFLFIGSLLLIVNLWTNAVFIENRMAGTPIMQVALVQKADYCSYKYIFYKVGSDGVVSYLCPNHFGLVPSVGKLAVSPDFITTQLSLPAKNQRTFN